MDIFELLLRPFTMFFDKDTDKDTKRDEAEIWATLHRHLQSILTGDFATYAETSTEDLSVYEMFLPHRLDGLDLHRFFMIEHCSAGTGEGNQRYDLLEPRLRRYGDTAVVSYTFLLTVVTPEGIRHRYHNETRVLVRRDGRWQVIHVHKSPAAPSQKTG